MSAPTPSAPPRRPRRRHPWRDGIEGLLSALALVLIIRQFAFEVFKIPTGSMAPTLLGQHRDVACPNCGYLYRVDGSPIPETDVATDPYVRCPNCWYGLSAREVQSLHCSCLPSWPERLFWKGGNRVIVNKFLPHARPVRRWEIIVFKYPFVLVHCRRCADITRVPQDEPLPTECPDCGGPVTYERQNFIKRLIGLPGEDLVIRHGDIYINGELQRKPPEVQEAVWQHVYDNAWPARDPVAGFSPPWKIETGGLKEEGKMLSLLPAGAGAARLRYAAPIRDFAPYNRWRAGENPIPVGDLRWSVEARLDAPGLLRLGIEEDGQTFSAVIPFGNGKGIAYLMAGKNVLAEGDFIAEPGRTVRISFANADDRLELKADGRLLCSYDMPAATPDAHAGAESNGAWLEAEGARADFGRVRLQRDLYYLTPNAGGSPNGYRVPSGSYFAMGDNTRNSLDSRYWGPFPERNLIGIGAVVWWPLNQVRPCR